MKVKVNKFKAVKYPENEVKTSATTLPYKTKNVKFDESGIFSDVIFGRIGKCNCGRLTEPGYCGYCNTRVVDYNNLPDYWFDLSVEILTYNPLWSKLGITKKERIDQIKAVLSYTHFIYLDTFVNDDGEEDFDISFESMPETMEEFDSKLFKEENIYIGREAAQILGVSEEWLDQNLSNSIYIPHPIYRPLIMQDDGTPFVSDLNDRYIEIINRANKVKELSQFATSKIYNLVAYKKINEVYQDIVDKLLDQLQTSRRSILRSEIIAHPVSGAIRGTLLNRHDINEDVMLIGDAFVKTLYPYLYSLYDGDVERINKELIDENYVLILNRPPSISYMSVMGVKPRIASIYPYGHIEGTDGALKENPDYVNSKLFSGNSQKVQGDIETYSTKFSGRLNYDNLPDQIQGRGNKVKYQLRSPFGPVDRRDTVLEDLLKNPKRTKVFKENRTFNHYKMDELEEIFYNLQIVRDDSAVNFDLIIESIKEFQVHGVENRQKELRANELPIEQVLEHINSNIASRNEVSRNDISEQEYQDLNFTLAKKLFESDIIYAPALTSKTDSINVAAGLKKRQYDMIVGSETFEDALSEMMAQDLNTFISSYIRTDEHALDITFIQKDNIKELRHLEESMQKEYLFDLILSKEPYRSDMLKSIDEIDFDDREEYSENIRFYNQVVLEAVSHLKQKILRLQELTNLVWNRRLDEDGNVMSFSRFNIEYQFQYITADGVSMESSRGISINPIIEDGMAADTDGDVLFTAALYGRDANKEAETLLSSRRYTDYTKGETRNGIIEDFFYGQDN